MSELLETLMVLCFGASWPANIFKSYTSRTAKGKSLSFLIIISIGYLCGMASKNLAHNITYVFYFYILNTVLIFMDILLYFRNRRLDREREACEK